MIKIELKVLSFNSIFLYINKLNFIKAMLSKHVLMCYTYLGAVEIML